jgi:excisionase family DNA binding protein
MRTLEELRRHLKATFDRIEGWCQYGEPDFYTGLDATELAEEAQRLACRLACDLPQMPARTPHDALRLVGCLLAWADAQCPYFDSSAACNYLGVSEQSLYGLGERKRLIPLRGPRRTYRFTRQQLDDYLAQDSDI